MNKLILLNELKNRPNIKEFYIYPREEYTGDSFYTMLNQLIDVCYDIGTDMGYKMPETTYIIHIVSAVSPVSLQILKTEKLVHTDTFYIDLSCQCTCFTSTLEESARNISENVNVSYEPGVAKSFHFKNDSGNNVQSGRICGEIYLTAGGVQVE